TQGGKAAVKRFAAETNSANKQSAPSARASRSTLVVQSVDNWHRAWDQVLAHIQRFGKADKLSIDLDGWLSAREVVLVAFVGGQVAGHISFGVTPGKKCVQ